MSLPAQPSLLLSSGFVLLSVLMTAGFAWWTGRGRLAWTWFAATGLLGASGWLADFGLPPRPLFVVAVGIVGITVLARRADWHRRRSLAWLVGFQSFRIPVELLIWLAVSEGVAPPQFTWTGANWDVITGVTALLLCPFVGGLPSWVVGLWNALGLALLINVVVVAILSMPTPLQQIHPDNVWVAFFPFQWLPFIHVVLAWLGHLLLFMRLRDSAR